MTFCGATVDTSQFLSPNVMDLGSLLEHTLRVGFLLCGISSHLSGVWQHFRPVMVQYKGLWVGI